MLIQAAKPDKECGWFTVLPLSDGKIALKTCHNRYVTSPRTGMKFGTSSGERMKVMSCDEFLKAIGQG